MFIIDKRLTTRLAALMLGLATAGLAVGATQAHSDSNDPDKGGPLSCEIEARHQGGMLAMRGVVHADTEVSGSYQLRVRSVGAGGSTDISQGGGFTAGPGDTAELGQVMLGGAPAYDVQLDVDADGIRIECEERFEATI